jgi:hypothetical protein
MLFLNLPPLPEQLAQDILHLTKEVKMGLDHLADSKTKMAFFKNTVKVADCINIKFPAETTNSNTEKLVASLSEVYNLYSSYLPIKEAISVKFFNRWHNTTSTRPPHVDASRIVGINYYIELGGANVVTKLYKDNRPLTDDLSEFKDKWLTDQDLDQAIVMPKNRWVMFNTQTYHAVENIETSRIFLILVLENNPTMEEFLATYPHLISDV